MWHSYSAWCCRQGGHAQCNPAVIGAGVILVILVIGGGAQLRLHWTGFMQIVAVALALILTGAAVLLFRLAMLITARAPLPAPAAEPVPAAADPEPAPGTWFHGEPVPADVMTMIREADRLARGELDIVVSEAGTIHELTEPAP